MFSWVAAISQKQETVTDALVEKLIKGGFVKVEPAPTLRESWTKFAQRLGVRLSRQSDWDNFWQRVAYKITCNTTASYTDVLADKVRKTMCSTTAPASYPRRSKYLLWAAGASIEKLRLIREVLSKMLAQAAQDANQEGLDRPSWFNETLNLCSALQEAEYTHEEVTPPERKFNVERIGDKVRFEGKEYSKDEIADLALVLLESALLADSVLTKPTN